MRFVDLGDLLLAVAVLFSSLILVCEWVERRRESRRRQALLDAIDAEYRVYFQDGLFPSIEK